MNQPQPQLILTKPNFTNQQLGVRNSQSIQLAKHHLASTFLKILQFKICELIHTQPQQVADQLHGLIQA
jgi:hypothetical protein